MAYYEPKPVTLLPGTTGFPNVVLFENPFKEKLSMAEEILTHLVHALLLEGKIAGKLLNHEKDSTYKDSRV